MINPASHQPRQPLHRGALSRPPNQPPRPHEKITHRRQMSMKSKIQTPRPRSQTALSQTQRSRHSRPHQFTNILSSTHSQANRQRYQRTTLVHPCTRISLQGRLKSQQLDHILHITSHSSQHIPHSEHPNHLLRHEKADSRAEHQKYESTAH